MEKVIVIGGSSGIGKAIAEACTQAKMAVTVASRRTGVDATDEGAMERLFANAGAVHHVVLTAVEAAYPKIREIDIAAAKRAIDSKLLAALLAAKHARFAENASLTLTSGIAMDRPGPHASIVAAMNGAVTALGRALAIELAPVRVNVLSPGWIDTPVWDAIAGSAKDERFAAQAAKLPVKRVGTTQDVAQAALFLMRNGFVTGECLHVDGGHRLV
jgi:NAD(P)-dependent dehydrogenase (short-subunit alcohol dehydrogenase family)